MPTAEAKKRKRKPAPGASKPRPALVKNPAPSQPADPPLSPRAEMFRQRVAPAILLALITFALYFPVIHHPFSNYDDAEYVGDNAQIHHGITLSTVRWALTSTEHANWHPVTWLSHTLDWQLFGSFAAGHHFTNLALHIFNVVLLFLFLSSATRSTLKGLLCAALFALHPINVESVAWIAERKNVLCAFFFLLTLIAYLYYARRPNVVRYLLVFLSCALALASKPMAVTLPLVLLLADFWPLQRIENWTQPSPAFPTPQFSPIKLLLEKLPLFALSAADCWLTIVAQQKVHAIRAGASYPPSLRLENAIFSYAVYLWKIIYPARLAVLYPYPAGGVAFWRLLLSVIVLIAISVLAWRKRSVHPYLLSGWLWFLGMLLPVIGLVQVGEQGMADRYAYLPVIGIFIMLVWAGFDLAQKARRPIRMAAGAVTGVALIALAFLTSRQIGYWGTNYALWAHTAAVTEFNGAAEDVAGSELLLQAMNNGTHISAPAQVHFQRALQINPHDSEALMNIGADLQLHGRINDALAKYTQALQYTDDEYFKPKILSDMGSAYEQLGDFATARQYFLQALEAKPASNNDNSAFLGYARTFTDEKIAAFSKELSAHPSAAGFLQLGQMQEEAGYTDAARSAYQRALDLDPKLEVARTALARLSSGKSVNTFPR